MAPIAPGLVVPVAIRNVRWLEPDETVSITFRPGTLALDGERETAIGSNDDLAIRLNKNGPTMVDVDRTLELAADSGEFIMPCRSPA